MNPRLHWLQHKGKRIFVVDVRDISRDDQLRAAEELPRALAGEADGSVLLMVQGGKFEFHPEIIPKIKANLLQGQPKIMRSALVGTEGILRVALDGYIALARFLGMAMNEDRGKHFDSAEEAKDWLVR